MRTHCRKPRRLEAKYQSRWRQVERLAQERTVEAAKKATTLQNRIARSARIRRARQLRKERLAAKKEDEWEVAAETARRCPDPGSLLDSPQANHDVAGCYRS